MRLSRVAVNFFPRLTRGEQEIANLLDNVADFRPLMRFVVAPMTLAMLKRHWDTKGSAFNQKWAAWKPATLRARRRKGNVALGLLRDTDHLFGAIFADRPTDSRLRNIAGGLRFQLNTQVPYAPFLHFGTRFMVARHVVPSPMPEAFRRKLRATIREYLLNKRIMLANA